MAAGSDTLPQTFERRGTCVPLISVPTFNHLRVREYVTSRGRLLEATIPNFSGTRRGEFAIVDWKQLPSMATLSERDSEVHARIMESRSALDLDPINVRSILQHADAAYNPDEERRRKAREQTQRDLEEQEIVRMSCIAQMTRECGVAQGDSFMARASTQSLLNLMSGKSAIADFRMEELIAKVMSHTALRAGCSVEDVRDWLEPLVGLIAPFGSVASEQETRTDGFLFRQHLRLLEFRGSLKAYATQARPEVADSAELILKVLDQTITYVSERIVRLDALLASIAGMFRQVRNSLDQLQKLRRDVAYGLDGWDDLVSIWLDAVENSHLIGGEQGMERAIGHILWHLPMIPYKELHGDAFDAQSSVERARVKLVSQMHSWQTDEMDFELQDRVERGKTKSEETGSRWEAS
ncbi:hypothetical protein NUH88_11675 [Nisaea acidiphila]|uniref:Uncharacterized protein n=1 Tax=Nisaea acidiphila TaxID=1862145 RepID=A0A9J7ALN1_9PROT|nr:hypothetical protein [Nisaea acidiphila]UUX48079.1 hypothetical protein NUH88_11675 [Nisaea acidiphila]